MKMFQIQVVSPYSNKVETMKAQEYLIDFQAKTFRYNETYPNCQIVGEIQEIPQPSDPARSYFQQYGTANE